MSQEQPARPVTYKDVFGDVVQGEVAAQPVTVEDAALMQSAETVGLGKTNKGGAASLMQAAADKNVREQIVDPASHSDAAERGFGIRETMIDGKVVREELVGQQPVTEETTFVPTLPEIAASQGITIGEALEEAAMNDPEKLVDKDTARVIQSAEARATGIPIGFKGGLGATAQSASQKNEAHGGHVTISDILNDATEKMLVDKVVTEKDVEKLNHLQNGGGGGAAIVVEALQGAVEANSGAERYIKMQQAPEETGPETEKLLSPAASSDSTHVLPPSPQRHEAVPDHRVEHAHVE